MFVTEESDTDTFCQSWTCLAGMSGYALSLAKKSADIAEDMIRLYEEAAQEYCSTIEARSLHARLIN